MLNTLVRLQAVKILLVLVVVGTLGACATADRHPAGSPADEWPGGMDRDARTPGSLDPDVEARPLGRDGRPLAQALDDPDSPLSTRVIYFEFDRDTVRSEFVDVIAAHGDYLSRHSEARVRLEGHTDERGTREYNLSLGERRAQSVRRMLMLQGARDEQIQVVSYGEEMPAELGSNEEAWEQNRRVEIVHEGGR
ncbi:MULTISPECIES: peptidoglycan-associated lipoprotein Pal [unclassified Ectothiorhodospira]|uniref:peptidoglycan-associated lipoprotein Pal n=1 Tax=unclassified Ectothiorhodospira TaxID=2684909 RepID=UPI001EE80508|nr:MULTISPECIES: peptidoglycan-associated lipoprotein Pal [unclassified Ectothiorhodospira]MCG5515910.1 peptidoglycan-associated lipoprotein Pal [Ectothiorhodospira sp. 9100]MCG5518750.1 peptidoglycan-associated lipoprotein Pal [Ectothiorhodospira sp. 9905]